MDDNNNGIDNNRSKPRSTYINYHDFHFLNKGTTGSRKMKSQLRWKHPDQSYLLFLHLLTLPPCLKQNTSALQGRTR